jgi:hypothetical protein
MNAPISPQENIEQTSESLMPDAMKVKTLQSVLSELLVLNIQFEEIVAKCAKKEPPYQSEQIDQLADALAKAQAEYNAATYNRENPYFKSSYADLDSIIMASRPALTKHGIAFIQQQQITEDGATMLHTRVMHKSGQWIESRSRIVPPKNDAQTYGSTLSYHKRYAAQALLGVTISEDRADDDAEVAMVEAKQIVAKGPSNKYDPRNQSMEPIVKEQLEELERELALMPDLAEEVMDKMRIQSLADMPKSQYVAAITRIREIKKTRFGK